jgi:hypothetical protein
MHHTMDTEDDNKSELYHEFAEHCLRAARLLPDQQLRWIHREMAAEWLRLSDSGEET